MKTSNSSAAAITARNLARLRKRHGLSPELSTLADQVEHSLHIWHLWPAGTRTRRESVEIFKRFIAAFEVRP